MILRERGKGVLGRVRDGCHIGQRTSSLFECHWKWCSVEDSAVNDIVFEIKAKLSWFDHTHSDESIYSNVVADGNFERGRMPLFAGMRHVVLDHCR